MMPSSVGPLSPLDARLFHLAIGDLQIVQREEISSRGLALVGSRKTILCPDIALYGLDLRDGGRRQYGEGSARIVVMDWTWSQSVSSDAFQRYLSELVVVCDGLARSGRRVVVGGHSFLPEHGQDDIAIARIVAERCTERVEVDSDTDVSHLLSEYQAAAFVLGTRLHSCLMAISVGTPAVGLAYQEKTWGVAKGLGDALPVFAVDGFRGDDVLTALESLRAGPVASEARNARNRIVGTYAQI